MGEGDLIGNRPVLRSDTKRKKMQANAIAPRRDRLPASRMTFVRGRESGRNLHGDRRRYQRHDRQVQVILDLRRNIDQRIRDQVAHLTVGVSLSQKFEARLVGVPMNRVV